MYYRHWTEFLFFDDLLKEWHQLRELSVITNEYGKWFGCVAYVVANVIFFNTVVYETSSDEDNFESKKLEWFFMCFLNAFISKLTCLHVHVYNTSYSNNNYVDIILNEATATEDPSLQSFSKSSEGIL
jgi:RsiW-degrading membrane proteinase PrsW (M82 family)